MKPHTTQLAGSVLKRGRPASDDSKPESKKRQQRRLRAKSAQVKTQLSREDEIQCLRVEIEASRTFGGVAETYQKIQEAGAQGTFKEVSGAEDIPQKITSGRRVRPQGNSDIWDSEKRTNQRPNRYFGNGLVTDAQAGSDIAGTSGSALGSSEYSFEARRSEYLWDTQERGQYIFAFEILNDDGKPVENFVCGLCGHHEPRYVGHSGIDRHIDNGHKDNVEELKQFRRWVQRFISKNNREPNFTELTAWHDKKRKASGRRRSAA